MPINKPMVTPKTKGGILYLNFNICDTKITKKLFAVNEC